MASERLTEIIKWLNAYKEKTGCNGVVLGISGGKDSTTVAMLAKKVWGDNVIGVLMPNGHQADIADARQVVSTLGIQRIEVDISSVFSSLIDSIVNGGVIVSDKSKTNIPPRIRMMTLYAIAQTVGYRVVGTGNASEAYIGWTTKWGDSAYDLNPIYHLTCTEVVELGLELAEEFGLDKELVQKIPSDGLTGKSDEDNFGFTYNLLDTWISKGILPDADIPTLSRIERLHDASEHKRSMPYVIQKKRTYQRGGNE